MPNLKRTVSIILRCIPVVVALGFLIFYVARARTKRNEMFSSSKNLRALSNAADQWFLENPSSSPHAPPTTASPPPPPAPPISDRPDSSRPTDADNSRDTASDPFQFSVLPERPITLGGSKSGVPVVESADLLRLWTLQPKTTYHTFDLPPVRPSSHEMTFSEPSIRVHVGSIVPQAARTSSEILPAPSPEPPTSPSPHETPPPPGKPQASSEAAPVPSPAPSHEP